VGSNITNALPVRVSSPGGKVRIEPLAILDSRKVGKKNFIRREVLFKWSNLDDEEAIWEDVEVLSKQFSQFQLRTSFI
jgi:hypothetical protein